MRLVRDQSIFLMQVADLIRESSDLGLAVTAGEMYRTPEQQAVCVRTGRSRTLAGRSGANARVTDGDCRALRITSCVLQSDHDTTLSVARGGGALQPIA